MAEKLGVSLDFVSYALDLLPLTIYSSRIYRHSLKAAKIQIAHRDQGDVEILALALALKRPLWTNDKDFGVTCVQTVTTAELLAIYFTK
jgi:predicted nucleic acid-binding protein